MNETIFVGRIGQVALRLDVSLILLAIIWIALDVLNKDLSQALIGTVFLVLIFSSILLHEIGHALAAHAFGIRTHAVILHAFGGSAHLGDQPPTRFSDIAISFAGPAVNLGLGGTLYLVSIAATNGNFPLDAPGVEGLVPRLSVANLGLGLFNLLPAYPLDGGKITRALLSLRLSWDRSRLIVARSGQALSIFIGLFGLAVSPLSLLFAIVLFLPARNEARNAKERLPSADRTRCTRKPSAIGPR